MTNSKQYYHDIACNGDRSFPIGASGHHGCSCINRLSKIKLKLTTIHLNTGVDLTVLNEGQNFGKILTGFYNRENMTEGIRDYLNRMNVKILETDHIYLQYYADKHVRELKKKMKLLEKKPSKDMKLCAKSIEEELLKPLEQWGNHIKV